MKIAIAVFAALIAVSVALQDFDEVRSLEADEAGFFPAKYVAKGRSIGNQSTRTDETQKAYCRCVSQDNTKGLSLCDKGCGNPTAVATSGDGCTEHARKCRCARKSSTGGNTFTFERCQDECEKIGMIIPKDAAGIAAAKNTGCNSNGRKLWVDVVTAAPTLQPTQAPTTPAPTTPAPTTPAPTPAPTQASYVPTGGSFAGKTTARGSSYKAWCRCVSEDNKKGLSLCDTGCGNPTAVATSDDGCTANARKCSCARRSSTGGNDVTFEECENECERIGMVIPKDAAGIAAAKNTGCGSDSRKLWVDNSA